MRRILVLACALAGCYRGGGCSGCSIGHGGPPPARCSTSTDCKAGASCRQNYCLADEDILHDECRTHDDCAELGKCSTVYVESFLGLDHATECAATSDEDCQRSRGCAAWGACSRVGANDVGCAAANVKQCAASKQCATRELCTLANFECVRDWSTCPKLVNDREPKWAESARLVWDYDSLRTPWHPGDLENATLACRFENKQRGYGVVRIADRCIAGPSSSASLRADVPLHVGEVITAVVQDRDRGRASEPFVQMKYEGDSPIRAADGASWLECVVVPRDVAIQRSKRELAAVDAAVASSARPVTLARAPSETWLDTAHVHAERAAMWLGWAVPELSGRVAKIEVARTSYETRLDATIRKLPITTAPIVLGPYRVTVLGHVCGAALRARTGAGSDDCALEIAIDNTSAIKHYVNLRSRLSWLRPAHDAIAATVEHRETTELTYSAARPDHASELEGGERVVVLVGGYDEGSVLVGDLDNGAFAIKSAH